MGVVFTKFPMILFSFHLLERGFSGHERMVQGRVSASMCPNVCLLQKADVGPSASLMRVQPCIETRGLK